MANLFNFDLGQFLGFFLVLTRVGGIFATAPVIGSTYVPAQIKVVASLSFALIIYPFVDLPNFRPGQVNDYLVLVATELLIGLVLGLAGRFLFGAIYFAGELVGMQMGLSMAMMVDPSSGQQVSVISQLKNAIAVLVFLAMDAHHVVVHAMVRSYDFLGPGAASISRELVIQVVMFSAGIFVLGFQIAAPLFVALFMANVIMGLMARAVPQMNVFVVGFPFSIYLGLFILMVTMPFMVVAMRTLFEMYDDHVFKLLQLMSQ